MTPSDFNNLVEHRLEKCKDTLIVKAKEYASDNDRLHNFAEAAKLKKTTKSDCALSFGMKHIISIIDIVRAIQVGNAVVSECVIDEKIGDAINYFLLIEACITQEMKERGVWK